MSHWEIDSTQKPRCPIAKIEEDNGAVRVTFDTAADLLWYKRVLETDGIVCAYKFDETNNQQIILQDSRQSLYPALEALRSPARFSLPTNIFLAVAKATGAHDYSWKFDAPLEEITIFSSNIRHCQDYCLKFDSEHTERDFRNRAWGELDYVKHRILVCQDIPHGDDTSQHVFIRGNYITPAI